jgi:LPXTG-motif cell wall-anchored protein
MNVRFPGFDTSEDWWAILGAMVVILVGLLGFFRYKKFF